MTRSRPPLPLPLPLPPLLPQSQIFLVSSIHIECSVEDRFRVSAHLQLSRVAEKGLVYVSAEIDLSNGEGEVVGLDRPVTYAIMPKAAWQTLGKDNSS